jgi:hypothetical protein
MLLIVIIMSGIVFAWVVPYFTSQATTDNATAAYAERFSTVWGSFATFATNIPETVADCGSQDGNVGCSPQNPYQTCTGTISSPYAHDVLVPANAVCVIKANIGGNVFAWTGSNLTIIGATVSGGLETDHAAIVTLTNAKIGGYSGFYNDGVVSITGSTLNTSGNTGICTDACDAAAYEGGSGPFTMINTTITGQLESEVSSHAVVTGNNVTGRLEIESATFGQVSNNKIGMLDLDQNGILVISGNTVYGNDSYFPGRSGCPAGTGTAICYGFNKWCASGNEIIVSGSHNEAVCVGNIEVDLVNTGSIPVNIVNAYMSGIPLAGPISWKLTSGGSVHNSLPITIPVGKSANVTMQWTPPILTVALPWTGIYFVFVSSHSNFVDGYLYFGHNPALTIQSQSRLENRTCPPCY